MFNRTELRHAGVFHAVASEGSIAAAARRLGKSAPAVHHDLKRFEAETGCVLFERVGRGLRLTAAGRLLHASVGRALQDIALTRARLAQEDPSVRTLRIGTVSGFGRYALAPRLFAALPRNRRIELRTGEHDAIVDGLSNGQLDLAVTFRQVVSTPIRSARLAEEEIVLVVPRSWGNLPWAELRQRPYVTYDEYEYVFGLWFDHVAGAQPEAFTRGDHVTELEEAMESVAHERGISLMPRDIVEQGRWKQQVEIVRPNRRRARNTVYLLSLGTAAPDAAWLAGLFA